MTGDDVLSTGFGMNAGGGYLSSEVDDLLRRVAAEVDAGRPAEPVVGSAAIGPHLDGGFRYASSSVDWFFEQFLAASGRQDGGMASRDPWRDVPPVNLITRPELTVLPAGASPQERRTRLIQIRTYLVEDCENCWRDFGQLSGTHLTWHYKHHELRTADGRILVSGRGFFTPPSKLTVGGKSFSLRSKLRKHASAEIRAANYRDYIGHLAAVPDEDQRMLRWNAAEELKLRTLADDAGQPVLYITGKNSDYRARARITFPDGRWLRFLVRGDEWRHGIMTAVDESGNSVIRYRQIRRRIDEVAVHPDRELTNELLLAIAISPIWLFEYFSTTW